MYLLKYPGYYFCSFFISPCFFFLSHEIFEDNISKNEIAFILAILAGLFFTYPLYWIIKQQDSHFLTY